jgi:phosphoglycerate dehydrogenase-like enzyme
MSEIVLVANDVFVKGEEVFGSCEALDVSSMPNDEASIAEAIVAHNSRALILGPKPYTGAALYEALGRTGGDRGAIIARFGVGHDGVDKTLAREHGIVVTNTPGVLDVTVAEHVFWLIGALARHVSSSDATFKSGRYVPRTGLEVRGKTLGILGFGVIGRRVAAMAHRGFGMRVAAADCLAPRDMERSLGMPFDEIRSRYGLELYTDDVDAVMRQADVLSLHLPANDQTRRIVNAERLGLMKPEAILINTARGAVVDEVALYDALAQRRLAGAALDVFEVEPYEPASPDKDLRTLDNIALTPHIGSNTREANARMARAALENVSNFLAGRLDRLTRVDMGPEKR